MPYLILCLISALLAGGGVWKYQAQKHELALANLSTDYLKRDFRALENANAETTRLQNQKDAVCVPQPSASDFGRAKILLLSGLVGRLGWSWWALDTN